MIKIRYADLPQGLHAQLRTCGRRRVIYLLPGLSPAQRRDALRRLTRTSRRGYGPPLPAAGVTLAVAGDVAKSTTRNGLAAIRCHPVGSAVLAACLTTAVVCYCLFVTVTVRFSPRLAAPPAAAGAAPARPPYPGGPGRSPGGGASAPATQAASTTPRGVPPVASTSGAGSVPSGRPGRPGPLPTGTWSGPGGVLPSTPTGPSPGTSPSPSPSPAPAPSPASPGPQPPPRGNPGELCLQLGPLGVCIAG